MLLAILLVVLAVVAILAFVVALRASKRSLPAPGAGPASGSGSSPDSDAPAVAPAVAARHRQVLDRLELGAEVTYDGQAWFVRGTQRVSPTAGPAWTVWHLDDQGQSGWMATTDGDPDHIVFAVRAELPETVDPRAEQVRWRKLDWLRLAEESSGPAPTVAEGRRQGAARNPIEELPVGSLERVSFGRDALPRRRLICERTVGPDGDGPWSVWIGDRASASQIDVPALGTVPPAS